MRRLWILVLVGLVVGSSLAFGQSVYRWVDEKGGVHFTDDPGRIPEKYQNQMRKENPPSEAIPATPQGQPPVPKPVAPAIQGQPVPAKKDAVGRGEEWWRGQVGFWQQKLASAQKDFDAARAAVDGKQQELDQAKFKPNSLKRKLQGELKGLEDKASEFGKQLEEAKYMLDRGLAKQAEEYLADPSWVKNK
jgi:hypothetical protein